MGRSVSVARGSLVVMYAHVDFSEDDDYSWLWEDIKGNLTYELRGKYSTLHLCDKWLGREDHAILENKHAYIGISEYCGIVSIWVTPKNESATSRNWCLSTEKNLGKIVSEVFSVRLKKVGTFSNGEAVFERV